jgi:hypothetical protein
LAEALKDFVGDDMREGSGEKGLAGAKLDRISRRMDVDDAIEALRRQCGQDAALKLARAGMQHARRARSRKRFEFWTAVAAQIGAMR